MDPNSQQGPRELQAEVDILSRVHHPHVLLLLGACTEPGRQALVYELMEGGSLADALGAGPTGQLQQQQGPAAGAAAGSNGHSGGLPWQDRVRIAAEVAAGLAFLHSGPSPLIHMDIKPANILLTRWAIAVRTAPAGCGRVLLCCAAAAGHWAIGASLRR